MTRCPHCGALTEPMAGVATAPASDLSEESVKSRVRLAASQAGWMLWRNNTGVAFDKNGRAVRFGLCNDSAQLNASIKSADLIGIRPGGQFVALEIKRGDWSYHGDKREAAQKRFLDLVNSLGGYGRFTTGGLE